MSRVEIKVTATIGFIVEAENVHERQLRNYLAIHADDVLTAASQAIRLGDHSKRLYVDDNHEAGIVDMLYTDTKHLVRKS